MAAPGVEAVPHRLSLVRRLQIGFFGLLIVLGVLFYVLWGLFYDGWLDNGVYAVTIVLLLFGVSGLWLAMPSPPAAVPASAKP